MIGFVITFSVGYLSSRLLKRLNVRGTKDLFIDCDKELINYGLFFPPLAKSLKKLHGKSDGLLDPNNLLKVRFYW